MKTSLQPGSKLEVLRPEPEQQLWGWGRELNLTEEEMIMASRQWGSPMCLLHSPDIATLEVMSFMTLYFEKYTSVLIPLLHRTAFSLQLPISSLCWALYNSGLFSAWVHISTWLNSCFMSLRHLDLIMHKINLHSSLMKLQLLCFFPVLWNSICWFPRPCFWYLSFLPPPYLCHHPVPWVYPMSHPLHPPST